MSLPVEAAEIQEYIPESLRNIVPAPKFRLRPASERDQRRFNRILQEEGLTLHGDDAMQAEILRAISTLWVDEDAIRIRDRYVNYLETVKQSARARLDDQETELTIPEEDSNWVAELFETIMREWKPLRRMVAANRVFETDAPKIALVVYLAGWKHVDCPFRLEGGFVPLETIDQLQKALGQIEAKAIEDKIEGVAPGLAFLELCNKAFALMRLTGDEEKNSPSPSPSSSNPDPSTTNSDAKATAGESTLEAGEAMNDSSPSTPTPTPES
jgi:hypothetical protein